MLPVALDIQQVIDEVICGGNEAEAEEGFDGRGDCLPRELVREEQGKNEQNIFCPLVGADGLEDRAQDGLFVLEALNRVNPAGFQSRAQSRAWIGDIGIARVGESGQIGSCVSDVVKSGKALLQSRELVTAGQVDGSIRGEDAAKQAKVVCDTIGEGDIGAGGEIDGPAKPMLFAEEMQYRLVIGQMDGIQRGKRSYLSFCVGFTAADPPSRNPKETGWVFAHEKAQRIVEGIGLDQGAVQVDAKRNGRLWVRLCPGFGFELAVQCESPSWTRTAARMDFCSVYRRR